MIVNLFRHTQAISILSILILCILIWMGFSFQENSELFSSYSPLFEVILSPILQHTFINRIISGAIVFWQCILINRIMVSQGVLSTNSFFPALFHFLIISLSPEAIYLSPALFSLTFVLFSVNKILGSYLNSAADLKIFDSSILMSMAVLFHPPFIILTPIVWIGMSIFSQGDWKHWLISIIAFICPWLLLYTCAQYFSIEKLNFNNLTFFKIEENIISKIDKGDLLSLVGFGLISILALTELAFSLSRKNIKARKSYILLLLMLLLSLVYSFLSPDNFHIKLLAFALPLSAIISNYFYYQKETKWLNFIVFSLLIFLFINHYIL